MSDPLINALVALTGAANQAINTLTVPPEERLIIFAMGKMFRNGDRARPWSDPEIYRMPGKERAKIYLGTHKGRRYFVGDIHPSIKKLPAIPIVDRPDGTYECLNMDQGVRFIIKVIQDKDEFVQALLTPGAHVVYDGHARYGRGPCFGPGGDSPGEMWEEGTPYDSVKKNATHPNKDGIFRMGFPFIGIEASEILEHGYTANLADATSRPSADDCDPDLRPHIGELKGRTLLEINPAIVPNVRDPDITKKWWSYGTAKNRHVVHIADWQNTLSSPDDIGAITPTCRVFSHMGCSTFRHNHPVVRKKKQWTPAADERYAYWTTNLSDFGPVHYWMQHLLTYKKFNAFQPLEQSLKYAVTQSNNMLNNDGGSCNII